MNCETMFTKQMKKRLTKNNSKLNDEEKRLIIEQYFLQLPVQKVPRLGTQGQKYRDRQIIMQLPKQDLALAYCKFVERENWKYFEDFVHNRNVNALEIGSIKLFTDSNNNTCKTCNKSIGVQEVCVVASKFGDEVQWHPNCFICNVCQELLVDLTYCAKDDKLYCERHYAETIKPRCSACDELIFSGEYTKAMGKEWHTNHFCCWKCDLTLSGQRYVIREGHPFCIKCYEQSHANVCEECTKPIGIDSKDLCYNEKHWHEACFVCRKCKKSLVDDRFGTKNDAVYCGDCYDMEYSPRCDGCGEPFKAGHKKMEYKGKSLHEQCFTCFKCQVPIGTKSFVPRENDIFCSECYELKYAVRCVKCSEVINGDGLTFKDEPWHKECFACSKCKKLISGNKFSMKDDNLYCLDCFGEVYAHKCSSCNKPIISGNPGGTRFVAFEDRNWHSDCFKCSACQITLSGRGFIMDGPELLCAECAKSRLSLS
ncbi:four and a half LIM domains protein 2-like isoform X3 [Oppia nitens]|uniref:four and a half LIM domains protein 2-like isoform X3 n=1 Tax=Oppia nitens TaxID=1686743 RepID=UPI0023DA9DCD|nr:four and a half LIM domains protein 2-like isoform X3 [Oppia nitens]